MIDEQNSGVPLPDQCSVVVDEGQATGKRCGNRFGYERPRLDRNFAVLLLVALAMWGTAFPFHNWGSRVVLAIVELTYLFGCPRTRQSTLWVSCCLYLPWLWVFLPSKFFTDFDTSGLTVNFFDLLGIFATKLLFSSISEALRSDLMSVAVSVAAFLIPVTIARIHSHYRVPLGTIIALMACAASYAMFVGITN